MCLRPPTAVAALYTLVVLSFPAYAQTSAGDKYSSIAKESSVKVVASKPLESVAAAEGRRSSAISLITSLADQANDFKDQTLRVLVQARAADALWDSDPARARGLFLRAWDAAEKIDKDGEQEVEETRRSLLTSRRGMTFIPPAPNLRSEVLRLAAKRDRKIGEQFLSELDEPKEEGDTNLSNTGRDGSHFFDPTEPSSAIAKRLELAADLIREGEVKQAETFAAPALNHTTSQGIIFLSLLRQRDAGAADERYARLLSLTAKDEYADATTISILSSYIFTPNLLVTATRRGRVSNQLADGTPAPVLSADLRGNFFNLASSVLLRPLMPTDQDHTSAGRAGTYFTIARLLPLFQQYMPDQVPALNARLAELAPDTPEVYKNNDNGMLTAGIVPDNPDADTLSSILDQLSGASGSQRDLLYVKAIRVAAMKGDGRIREFAEQIGNADLKKRARSFADFVMLRKAIDEKDAEARLRIISAGNLPPLQRVWAYTEFARLLRKSDPSRAIQLLSDAAAEAHGINEGESERAQALTCVAYQLFALDRARVGNDD